MYLAAFQVNKIRRLIRTQGRLFDFARMGLNEFGEPNGQTESISILGVYHETTTYLQKAKVESTTIRTKSSPMILCLWEDAKLLQHTDTLEYNGKLYSVTDIKDVTESGFIADISLEEVQKDGRIQA